MRHSSVSAIFGEWQILARGGDGLFRAPARAALEPRRLGRHLADLFILEPDHNGDPAFRLAGTRICALFGRELKGVPLQSLWPAQERPALRDLVRNIGALGVPALSLHDGVSLSGRSLVFEMLLAPLENGGFVGGLAAPDAPAWLGADPIVLASLDRIEPLAPDFASPVPAQKPVARAVNAPLPAPRREIPRLRVIAGGKAR